jgi:hypothetical protein
MVLGPLSYILGRRPGLFTKVALIDGTAVGMITPASANPWAWAYLK